MRRSRKFCQSGSNSDTVFILLIFLVDKGREDPNVQAIIDGGPTLNAVLVAKFVIFHDQYL